MNAFTEWAESRLTALRAIYKYKKFSEELREEAMIEHWVILWILRGYEIRNNEL